MDLKTPIRSQNQLVRATFQGSSFRSFSLPPGGSAVIVPSYLQGGLAGSVVLAERLPSSGGEGTLEMLGPVLFPTGQQIEESVIHVLRFLRRRFISLTRMARTNSETLS